MTLNYVLHVIFMHAEEEEDNDDQILFICIQAGTIDLICERENIEGQVNRTQYEYNLLGQRVVCQFIYIFIDFE